MLHRLVPATGREADAVEDHRDPLTGLCAGHPVEPRRVAQVLLGRHLLEKGSLDRDAVDQPLNGALLLEDVVPEDERAAAIVQQQGREQPDERRLPGAVLPEDGDALAALDRERDVLERGHSPPAPAQTGALRVAAEEFLAPVVDFYGGHVALLRIGGTRRQRTANRGGARKTRCQPTSNMAATLAAAELPRQRICHCGRPAGELSSFPASVAEGARRGNEASGLVESWAFFCWSNRRRGDGGRGTALPGQRRRRTAGAPRSARMGGPDAGSNGRPQVLRPARRVAAHDAAADRIRRVG